MPGENLEHASSFLLGWGYGAPVPLIFIVVSLMSAEGAILPARICA